MVLNLLIEHLSRLEEAYFIKLCGKRRRFLNNLSDIRLKQQRNAAVHHNPPPAETRQTGFWDAKNEAGKLSNRAT